MSVSSERSSAGDIDIENCPVCNDLAPRDGPAVTTLFQDFFEFDCPACKVIREVLKPYNHLLSPVSEIIISATSLNHTVLVKIRENDGSYASMLELELSTRSDHCPWSKVKRLNEISGDTGSEQSLDWVRRKLTECEHSDEHQHCKPQLSTRLPSRVIEITSSEQVRLFITSGESGRYCALSHCWGKQQLITTTTLNIEDHQQGIPWKNLPKTFQDAINFVWKLGVKYIWVDSLCIIQDDAEDWRREGGNMAEIYENSYFTPSATKSANSTEGCFSVSSSSHRFNWYTFLNNNGQEYLIGSREPLVHRSVGLKPSEPDRMPLLKRGWTLQELLLSPRVVHFNAHELVWECNSVFTCECGRIHTNSSAGRKSKDNFFSEFNKDPTLADTWHQVVREYTRRNLTYDKDIFPALQGMAKKFQDHRQVRYFAGLWEDTLLVDLLWTVGWSISILFGDNVFPQDRPIEWRGPSWSWASVTQQVAWIQSETAKLLVPSSSVVVETTPVGKDDLGELQSGTLRLQALCVDVLVSWDCDSSEWHSRKAEFTLELVGRGSNKVLNDEWFLQPDYLYNSPGSYELQRGLKLKVAIIVKHAESLNGYVGLALRELNRDLNVYERVGAFRYSSDKGFRGASVLMKCTKLTDLVIQ